MEAGATQENAASIPVRGASSTRCGPGIGAALRAAPAPGVNHRGCCSCGKYTAA
jgi:hypothetical protein